MANNVFKDNSSPYGKDIASMPLSLSFSLSNKFDKDAIVSGVYFGPIIFNVVDYYENTITNDNSTRAIL